MILADHILVEPFAHPPRRRQACGTGRHRALRDDRRNLGLLSDDRTAQRDTLITNKDGAGTSDEALHLILAPATKRTKIGPAAGITAACAGHGNSN